MIFMIIQYRPYTFVVPNVRAWSYEERLTRLIRRSSGLQGLQVREPLLTAIDIRQMEHSWEEWVEAESESFLGAVLPRSRRRLWVDILLARQHSQGRNATAGRTCNCSASFASHGYTQPVSSHSEKSFLHHLGSLSPAAQHPHHSRGRVEIRCWVG